MVWSKLIQKLDSTTSGGGRGRLAGARAPARKFFPGSPFVKYLKF